MATGLILETIFLPIALGAVLALLGLNRAYRGRVMAVAASAALLAILIILDGGVRFPPVASKHKLPYLVAAAGVLAAALPALARKYALASSALFLASGMLWLLWRRISSGNVDIQLALPALALLVVAIAARAQARDADSHFLWPVTLLAGFVAAGLAGLLGGYIGLGMVLSASGAALGGALALIFLSVLVKKAPALPALPPEALWVSINTLGIYLITLGGFATNLSPVAYIAVLSVLATPAISRRFLARTPHLQPFLIGGTALVPAAAALCLAALNF